MELRKRKKSLELDLETPKKIVKNSKKKLEEIEQTQSEFKIEEYLKNSDWKHLLSDEFDKDYFKVINRILDDGYRKEIIRPPKDLVFQALNLTKLNEVKCVILGQDPYHDDGQATGLAFSVPKEFKLPRTLQNIFTELKNDIPNFERDEAKGGCLDKWTREGVLLLNAFLTVEAHKPGSHSKIGWDLFTNRVISLISEKTENCVFILWGNFAQKKEKLIDAGKHKIIKTPHPSPLTFTKFLNSKSFSKTNEYLELNGKKVIDWSLK